jgi:hypothetical protein
MLNSDIKTYQGKAQEGRGFLTRCGKFPSHIMVLEKQITDLLSDNRILEKLNESRSALRVSALCKDTTSVAVESVRSLNFELVWGV